jgi:hypothetical protein
MRIRPMLILKWVLGIALAGYAGAVALLYVVQRDMLYRPPQADTRTWMTTGRSAQFGISSITRNVVGMLLFQLSGHSRGR